MRIDEFMPFSYTATHSAAGGGGFVSPVRPPMPEGLQGRKRMRWTTYRRLEEQYVDLMPMDGRIPIACPTGDAVYRRRR